jgi:hypothetical protein
MAEASARDPDRVAEVSGPASIFSPCIDLDLDLYLYD